MELLNTFLKKRKSSVVNEAEPDDIYEGMTEREIVMWSDRSHRGEPESMIECGEYRSSISKGILIEETLSEISFSFEEKKTSEDDFSSPSIILYDAYDGGVHDDQASIDEFRYIEYGEIWFDGNYISTGARSMEVTTSDRETDGDDSSKYVITAGRFDDHVKVTLSSGGLKVDVIVALPDSSKYAYIGITGEHCRISDIRIETSEDRVGEADIPRIVAPVSYIDKMEGDIPNIQINRPRSAATEGIAVKNGMKLYFHTMSLPSAHLVWHCPYIVLFSSADKKVGGPDYKEYALIRMNGENGCDDVCAQNSINVERTDEFKNWDTWKEINKRGLEIEVSFYRRKNTVFVTAEDAGIVIENITVIKDAGDDVYFALTGDQCALTDIRIRS